MLHRMDLFHFLRPNRKPSVSDEKLLRRHFTRDKFCDRTGSQEHVWSVNRAMKFLSSYVFNLVMVFVSFRHSCRCCSLFLHVAPLSLIRIFFVLQLNGFSALSQFSRSVLNDIISSPHFCHLRFVLSSRFNDVSLESKSDRLCFFSSIGYLHFGNSHGRASPDHT